MYDKLSSIPPMTPALMRASKAAKKSGEYKEKTNQDIIAELENILENIKLNQSQASTSEIGELLFLLSILAFKSDIDAEETLFKKTNAFIEKFKE